MKHHEYQLYYGGVKEKIAKLAYCKDCGAIVTSPQHKIIAWSHKKLTGKPRKYKYAPDSHVISQKN